MSEQRDMTGTLSKNTRKEKPSHADYTGSIIVNGEKYWLNAWSKQTHDGARKFLSLSVRRAEEQASTADQTKPAGKKQPAIATDDFF